jgi:hypothetical protein
LIWDIESDIPYGEHLRYSVPVESSGTGIMYVWDESDILHNNLSNGGIDNWNAIVVFRDSENLYCINWYARGLEHDAFIESLSVFISLLQHVKAGSGRTIY